MSLGRGEGVGLRARHPATTRRCRRRRASTRSTAARANCSPARATPARSTRRAGTRRNGCTSSTACRRSSPPAQLQALDAAWHLTGTPNAEIALRWYLDAIRSGYQPARDAMAAYMTRIGRRYLVVPLYEALAKTPDGPRVRARRVREGEAGLSPDDAGQHREGAGKSTVIARAHGRASGRAHARQLAFRRRDPFLLLAPVVARRQARALEHVLETPRASPRRPHFISSEAVANARLLAG